MFCKVLSLWMGALLGVMLVIDAHLPDKRWSVSCCHVDAHSAKSHLAALWPSMCKKPPQFRVPIKSLLWLVLITSVLFINRLRLYLKPQPNLQLYMPCPKSYVQPLAKVWAI